MAIKGGKRPGAGRKPSTIKGLQKVLPKDAAALILIEIKANQIWAKLAQSEDERIQLDTLKYMTDRAYGKAMQPTENKHEINVNRIIVHEHHVEARQLPEPKPEFDGAIQ